MSSSESMKKALVLMSGGQDSTTCLVWAMKNFSEVSAVSFFYNQKHSAELDVAKRICDHFNINQKVIDISFMKDLVVSNLFKDTPDVNGAHSMSPDVPSSFVPYRNLVFLTLAAAWAGTIGARNLVTGVCETDYSGYADCRDVFIKSTQVTLNLATDFKESGVIIHTPLMWLTKAEEFKMADDLGCLDFIINETLTCYNGVETMNNFGKGCGECPSCLLRKKGFEEFLHLHKGKK